MKKTAICAAAALFLSLAAGCGSQGTAKPSADIGKNEAADIALSDAGVSEEEVSRLYTSREQNNGAVYYDISFTCQGTEYNYEIQASDGLILKSEADKNSGAESADAGSASAPTVTPTQEPSSTSVPTPSVPDRQTQDDDAISFEEAKQMALDRVPGASGADIEMELERDDGFLIYEGEIHYNRMEYEFEIDAATGTILEWTVDYEDD